MEKNYLVIDLGSSSKRYAFFSGAEKMFQAHFSLYKDDCVFSLNRHGVVNDRTCTKKAYDESSHAILDQLMQENLPLTAVGIRIVAPGTYFTEHQNISEVYLDKFAGIRTMVPLHSIATIDEISAWQQLMPEIPFYAISDSAFHVSQPPVNRQYNIPLSDTLDYDLFRFGYHGISCASIVHKLKEAHTLPDKIIICHLGSGCSVTAVKNGKSIHTSMGFTPLEGLCMSTRIGTIDAGALLYLQQQKKLASDALFHYLNTECGLKGSSGTDGDMRSVLDAANQGNTRAQLALDIFVKRIQETIAAYTISLGGLDLIVFTATMSEKSPEIRHLVCTGLTPLGVVINKKANDDLIDNDGYFESPSSHVQVAVIRTDEVGQMVRELDSLVSL